MATYPNNSVNSRVLKAIKLTNGGKGRFPSASMSGSGPLRTFVDGAANGSYLTYSANFLQSNQASVASSLFRSKLLMLIELVNDAEFTQSVV